jgi:hypothetical protein
MHQVVRVSGDERATVRRPGPAGPAERKLGTKLAGPAKLERHSAGATARMGVNRLNPGSLSRISEPHATCQITIRSASQLSEPTRDTTWHMPMARSAGYRFGDVRQGNREPYL